MFPAYVRTPMNLPDLSNLAQAQGVNECGVTTPANALTLMYQGTRHYSKDQLRQEAGWWFRRSWGGSPSFVTGWLLRRHGAGTHFGSVAPERGGDALLRDLLDRGLYVCIEIGRNKLGPITLFGEHSVLLVGYTDKVDPQGQRREEYYILDAARTTPDGTLDLAANDEDRDGDGVVETYPGNRTFTKADFWQRFPTGIYFPVFPSQTAHDNWYRHFVRKATQPWIIRQFLNTFVTGSRDTWIGETTA